MAWGNQCSCIFALAIVCFILLNVSVTTTAQAADGKENKKLQRLEQNAASSELDDGTLAAVRNILAEEERLLKYLNTADSSEYETIVQKRRSISRRSCIRRGDSCDARPNDCCEYSACRCNLWGTNCRCQRAGLLQRLG